MDTPASAAAAGRSADTAFAGLAAKVAIAVGMAIAAVGLIDVALVWWPLQLGDLQWEFGTISRTFDGLPLATLGLGSVLAGVLIRRGAIGLRVMTAVLGIALLVLLALAVLYVMSAAAAWGMAAAAVKGTLKQAFLRTGLFAGIYLAVYGWMTWTAIRVNRSHGKGRR